MALIMGMTIMAILIAAVLPLASTEAQRDKEDELIFRGFQYAEGIRTFRRRYGRYPNTLKEMFEVRPRTLRKLWKDPMTNSLDWGLVSVTTGAPLPGTTPPRPPGGASPTPVPTAAPTPGFGANNHDQLLITGGAFLDGTVTVQLINGYTPTEGTVIEFMRYGSVTGNFAQFVGLNIGGGLSFLPVRNAGNYQFVVVPEPASVLGVGAAGLALGVWVRRRRKVEPAVG
ncbi:MAG TPA: PEP-CTERM sorting domain-containing protein [Thermoanaerobaculia bacterium]|nr:PEP-CTERM sorting domain-containing protein [Thermoanaerobaculia bacterium]